jgi:hypothetical protein
MNAVMADTTAVAAPTSVASEPRTSAISPIASGTIPSEASGLGAARINNGALIGVIASPQNITAIPSQNHHLKFRSRHVKII